MQRISEVAQAIKPFVLGWLTSAGGAPGAAGYAPSPHDLSSAHHTGSIADSQATQFLKTDGSRDLLGNLTVSDGVTVDGVDLSAFKSAYDTHAGGTAHAQHTGGVGVHTHRTNPEGGQLDHGLALTGLGDDDHTIYASAEGSGTRRAYEAGRLNKSITAGTGLTGGGLLTADRSLAVDLTYAFTWSALHTFNAGARIAAGQNLEFGADVALTRSAANILGLASGDAFRSTGYASGINGWMIDASGNAEFNNVRVRGALHCAVFVKDLIEARAGSMLVTKSGGVLYADMTVPTSGTWTAAIEDPPGGGFLFADGDICRCKTEYASGIADIWFTVSGRTDNGNGTQSYTCTYASGDRSVERVYPAGGPVVDYGVSGDGGLLLTADDGVGEAPFLSVFTHAGSPWSAQTEHLRLGNLNGLADYAADAYGVFIGDYAGDKWLSYDPTNSLRVRGDALVEGTVTAEKLAIGDGGIFDQTNGKLLLGPGCPLTATAWTSLRGQAAAIANVLQMARGTFPTTQGLVLERGTTNYCFNGPMRDNDASTIADNWTLVETLSGAYTTSVVAHPHTIKGWMQRVQYTAGAGDAGAYVYILYRTAAASFAAGDAATLSVDLMGNCPGCTMQIDIVAETAANALIGAYTLQPTLLSGLNRYVITYPSLPATTDHVRATLRVIDVDNGDSVDIYWGAVNVEKLAYATSFCSGQLPWCAWSGTAYASTSVRSYSIATIPTDGNISATLGSISIWFRIPDNYNTLGGMFFSAGDTNGEFDAYITSDGAISYRFQGSSQANYAGPVSLGVDHHVVFTWDSGADDALIYFDGVLVADGDTGGSAPTLGTALGIGYSPSAGTNYILTGVITEFAVFGDPLTAAEVAAMWNLKRPLVDHGATDSPGIYIVDGRFRIASAATGTRIEVVPTEIAGYNGSTKQFWLSAVDGRAYCGAGKVVLGEDTYIKFLDGSGNERGRMGWDPAIGLGTDVVALMAYNGTDSAGLGATPGGSSWMWAYDATYAAARYWYLDGRYGARFTNQAGGVGMTEYARLTNDGAFAIKDGITAPAAITGLAVIYVDTADGDLKIRFSDGTIKTIVTDT